MRNKEFLIKLAHEYYPTSTFLRDSKYIVDEVGGGECIVGKYEDKLVLNFFPSTEAISFYSKDWWITNFRILFQPKIMPYQDCKSKARFHQGFSESYMQMRDRIHDFIKTNYKEGIEVFITGWSQGSAIGSICALDLQYNFCKSEDIYVLNMESPKCMNKEAVESYNKRVPNTIRLTFGNDPVVKLPIGFILNYHHVGKEKHYGEPSVWWKWIPDDHDIYITGKLLDCVIEDKSC